jgi:hypothetical protein
VWNPSHDNGWFGKVSPDGKHVAYGNWNVFCTDLTTSPPTEHSLGRGWIFGWADIYHLWITRQIIDQQNPREMIEVDVRDWSTKPLNLDTKLITANFGNVRGGHWGTDEPKGIGSFDGQPLVVPTDISPYGCEVAGVYFKASGTAKGASDDWHNWRLYLWKSGQFLRVITPITAANFSSLHPEGYVSYAGGGCRVYTPDGQDLDLQCRPDVSESVAVLCRALDGIMWAWTWVYISEDPNDWFAFGRPLGEKLGIRVPMPGNDLSIGVNENGWVISGYSDKGKLFVATVPLDAPRVEMPGHPPPVLEVLQPVTIPDYTSGTWYGWWVTTDKTSQPCNVLLTGVAKEIENDTRPFVLFNAADIVDEVKAVAVKHWDRCVALLTYSDDSNRGEAIAKITKQVATILAWEDANKLPHRPITGYCPHVLGEIEGLDWPGWLPQCNTVQSYDQMNAGIAAAATQANDKPLCICGRVTGGPENSFVVQDMNAIANRQKWYADALERGNVVMILMWAWNRGNETLPVGGILQPLTQIWWNAIAAKMPLPSIISLTKVPVDPPKSPVIPVKPAQKKSWLSWE